MKVEKEKLPGSRVKLTIEVPGEIVKPYVESAAKELSKEKLVKGFRPGSAPLQVMRSALGDQPIVERALQKLVPKTYVEAVTERDDLEAIGRPEVAAKSVNIDQPWTYEATVAVLPEVELGDYKELTAERKDVEVAQEEVEAEIEKVRKMRASHITVPRPAQEGDRLEIDMEAKEGNVPLEQGTAKQQEIILGETKLVEGFEKNILGMKEGETKTFPVKFPDQHYQKSLAGRTIDFTVTVKLVQQRVLPEANDEFAKGLGQFSGIDDLRNKLKENMEREKKERENQRLQQELLDQVVKKSTFGDMPDTLLQGEMDKMMEELERGVQSMGLTMDQYLQQIKKFKEQLREELKPRAEERVKSGLILREIAKAENLKAEEEEIKKEVDEALKSFSSAEEAKEKVDMEELKDVAKATIRNRKVFGLLEKNAGLE